MLNRNNPIIIRKILSPLIFSMMGIMLSYTVNRTDSWGLYYIFHFTIVITTFLYALWNIRKRVDPKLQIKVMSYIVIFSILFTLVTYVVNLHFQGAIAMIIGITMLVGFWYFITFDPSEKRI